jgi:hypothetical protein
MAKQDGGSGAVLMQQQRHSMTTKLLVSTNMVWHLDIHRKCEEKKKFSAQQKLECSVKTTGERTAMDHQLSICGERLFNDNPALYSSPTVTYRCHSPI